MSSMSPRSYNLPLFDEKMDFSIWKLKFKCILVLERVDRAIDLSYSATDTEEKKSEMNKHALSMIMLSLSDSVLRQVITIESAKELWDKLHEMYSPPSRMFLLEKFINFKLDLSKDIDENLECFDKLIKDLKLSGDKHIDDYTAFVLLNAIPESYSDVKSAIRSSVECGRGDLSMDIVVNALKCKELALKQGGSSEVNAIPEIYSVVKSPIKSSVECGRGDLSMDIGVYAFKGQELALKQGGSSEVNAMPEIYSVVKSPIKSSVECGRGDLSMDIGVNPLKGKELVLKQEGSSEVMNVSGGSQNLFEISSRISSDWKNLMRKRRKCYNCREAGHYSKDCSQPKRNKQDKQSKHAVMSSCNCTFSYGYVFITYLDALQPGLVNETEWLVYPGCTWHMTPSKNLLSNYKPVDNGFVSTASGGKCHVSGLGDVCLRFSSGFVYTLKNVRHVPLLRDNLLSFGALGNDGLNGVWGKDGVELLKDSSVMFKAERKQSVYICHAEPLSAPE